MKNSINVRNITVEEAIDRMSAAKHLNTYNIGGSTFSVHSDEVTGDFVIVSSAESALAIISTD